MDDIVKRLRELPDCHDLHGRVFRAVREAADEITQLRAALLDALAVFDIGEGTEFRRHYADIIARANTAKI